MKKIALLLTLMIVTMTISAENILYFTYNQAIRTVACLNSQNELMIYCGYDNELPTYVLINEVWAEQTSSSFYEIWLYGYDAYTGEEIFMPIDLECIYLMKNQNIYSAAQYLRFKYTRVRPTFAWAMPPYNPFVRAARPTVYYYTYHYDIHRPGWHYIHHPHVHYHPYYRRLPKSPAPIPPIPFTPGYNRPGYTENPNGGFSYTNEPLVGHITASRSQTRVQNDPTNRGGNRITSNRGDNTITTTDRVTGRGTTQTAPNRANDVVSRGDNSSSRGNSNSNRSGVSSDNGNSRSNNTTDRGSVTPNNNSSRGNSNSNRSGVSSDNGNSRSNNTTSKSSGTPSNNSSRGNSNSNRSGVSSDNGNSRSNNTTSKSSGTPSNSSTRSSNTTNRGNVTSDNSRNSSSSTSRNNSSNRSSENNSRGSSNRS